MNQFFQYSNKLRKFNFQKCVLRCLQLFSIIVFTTTIISCSSNFSEEVASPVLVSPAAVSYSYSSEEVLMIELVNEFRQNQGLERLTSVNLIAVESAQHNQYMIEHNAVSHAFFSVRAQEIIDALNATNVNENLAYNYASPQGALDAWLNSDDHRANIVGDFTNIGVAITRDPETDKPYYTMIFVKR